MNKVLVTGASGFLGSSLVRQLIERGQFVRALLRPGSSTQALRGLAESSYEIVRGDIQVEHEVYQALAGCDRMYHVAAVYKMWAPSADDILGPAIEGTRAALEAAKKRGLSKVVATSSVAAVGANPLAEPMTESFAFNLAQGETYVVAKWKAEQVALDYARSGLNVVVVNPTGIFGPGDWKPTPSGKSILQYLNWRLPLGFPNSAGGINVVDVDDVATGHIAAMEHGKAGERYILGGENLSFEQMFDMLSRMTGLRGPGKPTPRGAAMLGGKSMELWARLTGNEPSLTYKMARDYVGRYLWTSSEKAQKELGYTARDARETLHRSVVWFMRNGYVSESALRRIRLSP